MKTRLIIILAIIITWSPNWAQEYGGNDTGGLKYIFAKFDYSKDTISQEFSYEFIDNSLGDVISWHWDFGDGSTSDIQNPVHHFPKQGIYNVCLTVQVQSGDNIVQDHMCKKLSVVERGYNHLGGTVYAGYFPVDEGVAYLFKIDDQNNIQPYDTCSFDENGYYWFYNAEGGKYIVRVDIPESSTNATTYMPTYFGNTNMWTTANVIDFSETALFNHIELLEVDEFNQGQGLINGRILYEDGDTGENHAAEDITILLINDLDNSKTYKYSNENGQFEFNDIDFGVYRVHAEVTGKETIPLFTNLSEANPSTPNIDIIIKKEEVVSMVDEDEHEELLAHLNIYPNPAMNQLSIQYSSIEQGELRYEIYSLTGQHVQSTANEISLGKNKDHLDISHLRRGSYFLNIYLNHKLVTRKKVMKL